MTLTICSVVVARSRD